MDLPVAACSSSTVTAWMPTESQGGVIEKNKVNKATVAGSWDAIQAAVGILCVQKEQGYCRVPHEGLKACAHLCHSQNVSTFDSWPDQRSAQNLLTTCNSKQHPLIALVLRV